MKNKSFQDDHVGCGIGRIFSLPDTHPFHPACVYHDKEYDKQFRGIQTQTRLEVDSHFYQMMKFIARSRKSFKLKLLASVFYRIVRLLGGLWW